MISTMSYFQYIEEKRGRVTEQDLSTHTTRSFTNNDDAETGNNDNDPSYFPVAFQSDNRSKRHSFKQYLSTFISMAMPYFRESKRGVWLFVGMIFMTLLKSGVSVMFSFIGKDFWNALSSGDADAFYSILWAYASGKKFDLSLDRICGHLILTS